jgi:hypothetical protein
MTHITSGPLPFKLFLIPPYRSALYSLYEMKQIAYRFMSLCRVPCFEALLRQNADLFRLFTNVKTYRPLQSHPATASGWRALSSSVTRSYIK